MDCSNSTQFICVIAGVRWMHGLSTPRSTRTYSTRTFECIIVISLIFMEYCSGEVEKIWFLLLSVLFARDVEWVFNIAAKSQSDIFLYLTQLDILLKMITISKTLNSPTLKLMWHHDEFLLIWCWLWFL